MEGFMIGISEESIVMQLHKNYLPLTRLEQLYDDSGSAWIHI